MPVEETNENSVKILTDKPIKYILKVGNKRDQSNTAELFKESIAIDPNWDDVLPPDNPKILGPDALCSKYQVGKIILAENHIFLTKKNARLFLQQELWKTDVSDSDIRDLTRNSYRKIFDREASKNSKNELIFTYAEVLHYFKFRKELEFPIELNHLIKK